MNGGITEEIKNVFDEFHSYSFMFKYTYSAFRNLFTTHTITPPAIWQASEIQTPNLNESLTRLKIPCSHKNFTHTFQIHDVTHLFYNSTYTASINIVMDKILILFVAFISWQVTTSPVGRGESSSSQDLLPGYGGRLDYDPEALEQEYRRVYDNYRDFYVAGFQENSKCLISGNGANLQCDLRPG